MSHFIASLVTRICSGDSREASEAEAFRVVSDFYTYSSVKGPEGLSLSEEYLLLWDNKDNFEANSGPTWILKYRSRFLMFVTGALLVLSAEKRVTLEVVSYSASSSRPDAVLITLQDDSPTVEAYQAPLLSLLASFGGSCRFRMWINKAWRSRDSILASLVSLALAGLANKGVVRFTGQDWVVCKPEVKDAIHARLRGLIKNETDPDMHSVVLLAMCLGSDYASGRMSGLIGQVLGRSPTRSERRHIDELITGFAKKLP